MTKVYFGEIDTMVKYLLLTVLSIPCTYVVAMDDPLKNYHHAYSPLVEQVDHIDDLYPGYLRLNDSYDHMAKEDLYRLAGKYFKSPTKEYNLEWVRLILRKAEEKNLPQAADTLGYMWENGIGGVVNKDEAIRLYSKAGRLGFETGAMHLAALYQRENKLDLAYKIYAPLALQGNQVAQVNVANILLLNKGLEQIKASPEEKVQALKWVEDAAEKGFAPALTCLGTIYLDGVSLTYLDRVSLQERKIDPSNEKAIELYEEAIKKGDILAKYQLSSIYYKMGDDFKNKVESLLKEIVNDPKSEQALGKRRLGIAAHKLAFIYDEGFFKGQYLKKIVENAYEKAISLGNVKAKHNLNAFLIRVAEQESKLKGFKALFTRPASKLSIN